MTPQKLAQIEATIRDAMAKATAAGMVIEPREFGVGFSYDSPLYEAFPPRSGACRLCPVGAVLLKRPYIEGFISDAREIFQLSNGLDVWAFFDGFDGRVEPTEYSSDTIHMYNLGKKLRDERLAKIPT